MDINRFDNVHNNIRGITANIFNDYLCEKEFIINYENYQNLKLRRLHEFKESPRGCPGKGRKQCLTIFRPHMFYKRGFRNIKCSFQNTISKIELFICDETGEEKIISGLYNPNGVIFEQLRRIYKINDPLIIPLITERFIPYLENYFYKIMITYNELDSLDSIDEIEYSYEIIEIDENGRFIPFQYQINIENILTNKHFKDIQNIIPELKYICPRVEYSGTEFVINKQSRYGLVLNGRIQSILVYAANNSVVNSNFEIVLDSNQIIEIPTKTYSNGEYTILNFNPSDDNNLEMIQKYGVRSDLPFIDSYINLELEKYDKPYEVEIFCISYFTYEIKCGQFNVIVDGSSL